MLFFETTIGQAPIYISDGNYSSKYPKKEEFRTHGIPFVSANNLRDGRIVKENMKYITDGQHAKLLKGHISEGDVLVVTRGNGIGSTAWVTKEWEDANINAQLVLLRANDQQLNNRYLYYLISSGAFFNKIMNFKSGSAQPQLPIGALRNMPLRYHSGLDDQKRIASILSAYDDLIENNTRRIQILEEMAQRIYTEWFVNFRFPGHEKVKFVDSELGRIPSEWAVKSLDQVMNFEGGSQPPKDEWVYEKRQGCVRMIQIRDYESDTHISYVQNTNRLRKCEPEDIMIARYGASVGRVCWGLKGAYNVALVKVIPQKSYYREHLRSFLKDDFFQSMIIGMSGRAAQAGFNKTNLTSIRLPFPRHDFLMQSYQDTVLPMRKAQLMLKEKNKTLRLTRDLLLPKLISGEIDVSEMPDPQEVAAA